MRSQEKYRGGGGVFEKIYRSFWIAVKSKPTVYIWIFYTDTCARLIVYIHDRVAHCLFFNFFKIILLIFNYFKFFLHINIDFTIYPTTHSISFLVNTLLIYLYVSNLRILYTNREGEDSSLTEFSPLHNRNIKPVSVELFVMTQRGSVHIHSLVDNGTIRTRYFERLWNVNFCYFFGENKKYGIYKTFWKVCGV